MYFQQKTLKEQEQERVWKQHQAKNKETYSNKFNKNGNSHRLLITFTIYLFQYLTTAFVGDFSRSEPSTPASNNVSKPQQPLFDMNLFNENNPQNKLQTNILGSNNDNSINSMISNQLNCETNKPLSQLDQQQNNFMSTLNQTIQQTQSSMDSISKEFDSNKSDPALQLSERNDIFLTDKNWPSVSKLTDSKDPIASSVEKLEADENAGLGDILGGFADGDDDDILESLTADDFNILEYGDPELDEFNGSQNLLNKLDLDENQKTI